MSTLYLANEKKMFETIIPVRKDWEDRKVLNF